MYKEPSHIGKMQGDARKDSGRWWPEVQDDPAFLTLALCGEAGELANMIKKTIRGDMDLKKPVDKNKIVGEIVDVFTYLILLADVMGIDLERAYEVKRLTNEQRWGHR